MSRLSSAIHRVADKVKKTVSRTAEKAKAAVDRYSPARLQQVEAAVQGQAQRLASHVQTEVKRAAGEVGRVHVEIHEKLPGVRAAEGFLLRSAQRLGKDHISTGERLLGHVAGAALGLEIQQKAALSDRYAKSMGITRKEQKLARARTIGLAASIAAGAVASAVIAPAVAGAVGAAAQSVGIGGYTAAQTGATAVSLTASPLMQLVTHAAELAGQSVGTLASKAVDKVTGRYVAKYTAQVTKEYNHLVAEALAAYAKAYQAQLDAYNRSNPS